MNIHLTSTVKLYSYSIAPNQIPVKPDSMGSSGLEPPTSRLSGARSNLLSYEPIRFPLFATLVDSAFQLSPPSWVVLVYASVLPCLPGRASGLEMMGFEPMTPCLQGRCSPN